MANILPLATNLVAMGERSRELGISLPTFALWRHTAFLGLASSAEMR